MPTKKEVEDHFTSHDHPNYKHTVSEGKKYFRVQQGSAGDIARGSGGSVRLFVDKATGETWNSASAKAPNKKQASYDSFRDAIPDPVSPYAISDKRHRDPVQDRTNLERAHKEAKARAEKWRTEGGHPEGVADATRQAAHYEKKLAELHQGEKAEKAALVAQARSSFLIGAPERDPRVEAHATSGGLGLAAAKVQVEIEDLSKKHDDYRLSAKNLRIQAAKHEAEAAHFKDAAMQSDSPSYANMGKKHELSAKNLRNAAETEDSNARAVTQQILTKQGNLATAQGAYAKERAAAPAAIAAHVPTGDAPSKGATKMIKGGGLFAAGEYTLGGHAIDISHHQDKLGNAKSGGDWRSLTRQDHADMAVGLEHKLEELHSQAEHLEKLGMSSHGVRDEIAEHHAAKDAHHEAAFGKAVVNPGQFELPLNQKVAAQAAPATLAPQQDDPTARVAAQAAPQDQRIAFLTLGASGKVTRDPKATQAFAEKARERLGPHHPVQTGAKGGQFYVSATGAKIYVNRN